MANGDGGLSWFGLLKGALGGSEILWTRALLVALLGVLVALITGWGPSPLYSDVQTIKADVGGLREAVRQEAAFMYLDCLRAARDAGERALCRQAQRGEPFEAGDLDRGGR
ncbi:MAG TPA: hypothetical protein VF406_11780 [Thermodesulfobacteriota bacterium]